MQSEAWQWKDDHWEAASGVPLMDRGFRHGLSAFETLKIHRGRFVFLEEHLEKLRHSCARLGFREPPSPADFLLPVFAGALTAFSVARIYVTAGDGSFRSSTRDGRIFLLLEAAPVSAPPHTLGLSTAPFTAVWPGLKTGNYGPNITAYREAAEGGNDEIVLVNAVKHVVSASLANLFAVIDGLLLTPRVSTGARAGVVRDWVISREEVIISDFHPEQLRTASEIFLTSSGFGIAPISHLDGKPLPEARIGRKLLSDYSRWLDSA